MKGQSIKPRDMLTHNWEAWCVFFSNTSILLSGNDNFGGSSKQTHLKNLSSVGSASDSFLLSMPVQWQNEKDVHSYAVSTFEINTSRNTASMFMIDYPFSILIGANCHVIISCDIWRVGQFLIGFCCLHKYALKRSHLATLFWSINLEYWIQKRADSLGICIEFHQICVKEHPIRWETAVFQWKRCHVNAAWDCPKQPHEDISN